MSEYFMRIEAVNLVNTVYDTHNISTIRGGSYMLLDATQKIVHSDDCFEAVSLGASIALLQLKGVKNSSIAEELKAKVIMKLKDFSNEEMTFVVDVLQLETDDGKFGEGISLLTAMNRWSQMQQPTVIPPKGPSNDVCSYDGLRPINPDAPDPKNNKKFLSYFTNDRNEKGKAFKKTLYSEIVSLVDKELATTISDMSFTNDLEELSKDHKKGNLNGKIAFIYIDGNKFTKIRNKYCNSKEQMEKFDKFVRETMRPTMLKEILKYAIKDNDFKVGKKTIRLETLLWGGDEMEWVVPAWKGLEVLRLFLKIDEKFSAPNENGDQIQIPLTHACGIVFCHHSAPILSIRKAAHQLVDLVKEPISDIPMDKFANQIAYIVLESYDMYSGYLKQFLSNYYQEANYRNLFIKGDELKNILNWMKFLKKNLSKSKLYSIIQLIKKQPADLQDRIDEEIKRGVIIQSNEENVKIIINNTLNSSIDRWYLIADLWDYIEGGQNGTTNN